jgi:hypothetical protein
MLRLLLGASLVMALQGSMAQAAIITVDGWSAGDNRLTRDTSTGFEWLDVTVTAGISIDDFDLGYGALKAQGFQLASQDQVTQLFYDTGAALVSFGFSSAYASGQVAGAAHLQDLMGCITCGIYGSYIPADPVGVVGSGAGILTIGSGYGYGVFDIRNDGTAAIGTSGVPQGITTSYHSISQALFLFRATPETDAFLTGVDPSPTYSLPGVPEPGTWAMMVAGFGMAGASLRRRRSLVEV